MYVQAGLTLYWWQRLITFDSSRIRVKLDKYTLGLCSSLFVGVRPLSTGHHYISCLDCNSLIHLGRRLDAIIQMRLNLWATCPQSLTYVIKVWYLVHWIILVELRATRPKLISWLYWVFRNYEKCNISHTPCPKLKVEILYIYCRWIYLNRKIMPYCICD